MGVKTNDAACFPSESPVVVAHEGLLAYDSKRGKGRKERWFVLDATSSALIKCHVRTHQRARHFASTFGRSGLVVARAQALSDRSPSSPSDQPERFGVRVVAKSGETVLLYAKTAEEEAAWVSALHSLLGGLAHGVSERLARRELLAGKYSLVRELGRGASGVVSLYTWQDRPFAIKKFLPKKSALVPNRRAIPAASTRRPSAAFSQSPSIVPEDVRREIALLKKASNLPYVVALHDVILDCERNDYYLVMEFMGGGAIAEWDGERKCYVSSKKLKGVCLHSDAKVRTYLTNLVVGIQALHANRLCHRDIKPENLIANEQQTLCKIADLGVAHYFTEVDGQLVDEQDAASIELSSVDAGPGLATSASNGGDEASGKARALLKTTKGTYQFLPPEALTGDAFDGFKADVWAIGVTMYALLFGFLPFYSADVVQLFDKIERDAVSFPSHCRDEDAKDLLRRILEKDPETRIGLGAILQHPWMNRAGNDKAVKENVRALQRAPALRIEDCDVGSAVSVLQARFKQAGDAVRSNRLGELTVQGSGDATPLSMKTEDEYCPQPLDLTAASIPSCVAAHVDAMAAQLHFEWCQAKYLAGWMHGCVRSDAERLHPCLVPMRDLDADAQMRNLRSVEETVKGAIALGCRFEAAPRSKSVAAARRTSVPFPTEQVTLSWDLMLLVDLLAENSHEVWAAEYAARGWRRGDAFDPQAQTHPSLRPYMALDESEKELARAGVTSVMKSCVHLGLRISASRRGARD